MNKVTFLPILWLILLSSCAKDHDQHEHSEGATGADFYNIHCAKCHKKSGMGAVLQGIPPVIYHEMKHSDLRKFIINDAHEKDKYHKFPNMPKDEARKISRHISSLLKEKLHKKLSEK